MVTPFRLISTVSEFTWIFDQARWNVFTDPAGPDYQAGLAALVLGETIANSGLICVYVVTAYRFFSRKAGAPHAYICMLFVGYGIQVADMVGMAMVGPETLTAVELGRTIGAGIMPGLWVAYFLSSERVKKTFVF